MMQRVLRWGLGLLTLGSLAAVGLRVNLTPQIGSDFFFATSAAPADEPFGRSNPQVILSVEGPDIAAPAYRDRIRALSAELSALPGVAAILDIDHGPKDLEDAFKSPLWRRLLLTEDRRAMQVIVSLDATAPAPVAKLEEVVARHQRPDFSIAISGVPYVRELIVRQLLNDLRVFSAVTLAAFTLIILLLYRSASILVGTLVSCLMAAVGTLLALLAVGMKPGVLTANVLTITFVMTLSHIVFMTTNWSEVGLRVSDAVRVTATPSFWSMATTLLGFLTLLTATAQPLREFGIAGSIGCAVSMLAAYGLFPLYLRAARAPSPLGMQLGFLSRRHVWALPVAAAIFVISIPGLLNLDRDPSLFSYFRPGSDIRRGLEAIDGRVGSTQLDCVVRLPGSAPLNSKEAMKRLAAFQHDLEEDPETGMVLSIPVILAETERMPLVGFLPIESRLKLLEQPKYQSIGRTFITADRTNARFILRMREGALGAHRIDTQRRYQEVATRHGLEVAYYGGLYEQMGRLSDLVMASVYRGMVGLLILFAVLSFWIARAWRRAAAMSLGLCVVAAATLGVIGLFRAPVDIISSTAVNLAIGMGIDGMIHLVTHVRRTGESWAVARVRMGRPILASSFIVAGGFAVFALSNFPPTQRFGLFVVLGTVLSAFVILFVLPRPFEPISAAVPAPPSHQD